MNEPAPHDGPSIAGLAQGRSLALVGLMGAGKSCVGRRLAARLDLPFADSDAEVEAAAGCSIPDIFKGWGEDAFRETERLVIARLMEEGPLVLATGGGAYMDPQTREVIARGATSIWLRADLDILVERTGRRNHRPLLRQGNPRETLQRLMDERYPIYGQADVVVDTTRESADRTVDKVIAALDAAANGETKP